MRKLIFIALVCYVPLIINISKAEEESNPDETKDRIDGIDERLTEAQNDLSILKKIKISGYLQTEFIRTEHINGLLPKPYFTPYDSTERISTQFQIRRGRIKLVYEQEFGDFVFEGNFTNKGFDLKDLYLDIIDPWTKLFTLRAGLFKRPDYEAEFTSSQRESPERSQVILKLYPGERDLGAMLMFSDDELFTVQLAAFNNTFLGAQVQYQPTFREFPFYYMARVLKGFQIMDDLNVDLGLHTRIGMIESNSDTLLESDQPINTGTRSTTRKGESFGRQWYGAEAQIYYDFLGGMKILTEYLFGKDINQPGISGASTIGPPIRIRDFSGFYIMLVKNIGTDFQVVGKFDNYSPNTSLSRDKIDVEDELPINTFGFGLHNYTFDNVRLTLWYDIRKRGTNSMFPISPVNNILTFRFQYKF